MKIISVSLILTINCTVVIAQQDEMEKGKQLLDSRIRYGKLPNGFTYFIKSVDSPESKTLMRLYNRTGPNQEDRDQKDFAHAIEHLAFKATDNFPFGIRNSARVDSLNMRKFDYRAYTGAKSVKYIFNAPTGDVNAFNTGLLWFKDIINGIKLNPADIDQIRGELLQEYISNVGNNFNDNYSQNMLYGNLFPCKEAKKDFANHLKNFKPESLRNYYINWYNPDLMAISIVGNIDSKEVEEKIWESFSKIPSIEKKKNHRDCDLEYYQQPPQFTIVEQGISSSESNHKNEVNIHLFFREANLLSSLERIDGVKRHFKLQMLASIINMRLKEKSHYDKTFYGSAGENYTYQRLPPHIEVILEVKNYNVKESLLKAVRELHKLEVFGIYQEEWNNLKETRIGNFDPVRPENANYWSEEIEKFYLYGEALPFNKQSYLKEWLSNFSLDEFNSYIREILGGQPDDIGLMAPIGHEALLIKEKEIRTWIKQELKKEIEPYILPEVPQSLMSKRQVESLKEKAFIARREGKSGAFEFILKNGIKVVLESFDSPSHLNNNQIRIMGFSPLGANIFPGQYASAISAPEIIKSAGVNGYSRFEINQFLSKTSILPNSISTYIDLEEAGIRGRADVKDLEVLLQIIYLHFTKPNRNQLAFKEWKKEEHERLSRNNIDIDFNNAIREKTGDHYLDGGLGYRIPTGTKRLENSDKANLDDSYSIYQKIFGNPQNFTFLVSGDFNIDSVQPLIIKYLGNIPSVATVKKPSNIKEENNFLPPGPLYKLIRTPDSQQSRYIKYCVNFIENVDNVIDWKEHLKVEFLGAVATSKVWKLRFEKKYSLYDLGVSGKFNNDKKRYEIISVFNCVPSEFSAIRQEYKQIVDELKKGVITSNEFKEGFKKMEQLHSIERANLPSVREQKLYKHYRFGYPWVSHEELEKYIKSLTIQDIAGAAKKYLQEKNLYEFVRMNNENN